MDQCRWIFIDRMPVCDETGTGEAIVHYNHLGKPIELAVETKETSAFVKTTNREAVDSVIGVLRETRKRPELAYAVQARTKRIVQEWIKKNC